MISRIIQYPLLLTKKEFTCKFCLGFIYDMLFIVEYRGILDYNIEMLWYEVACDYNEYPFLFIFIKNSQFSSMFLPSSF